MKKIILEALGTKWNIIIDNNNVSKDTITEIKKIIIDFENKFSRFNQTSLVSKFNSGESIEDQEFLKLLSFGKSLETASNNAFSLDVGNTLKELGYGSNNQKLDFGGIGKGWLIDKIAKVLKENKYKYFLIDAGGDIFATTRKNKESWKVALEHPTKSDLAIGTIKLNNSALAASSPFKRTWDNKHHLIDTKTSKPTTDNRAVFITAHDAKTADGVATTLNVCDKIDWDRISKSFKCEYLVLDKNGVTKSKNFNTNFF